MSLAHGGAVPVMEKEGVRGFIVSVGAALVLIGLLWPWLGRLPGDLRFGQGSVRVFIPLGSGLLISIALSLVFTIISWLLHR